MSHTGRQFFSARTLRTLDVVLSVFLVVWVVFGVLIGLDIRTQAGLAEQVIEVGATLRTTGEAFDTLSGIPFVGGEIGEFSGQIIAAGTTVEQSGTDSRDAVHRMSWLVGIAFALLPAVLLLPLYLPLRLAWRRDVRAVRVALATRAEEPAFLRYLALRALTSLPYEQLAAMTQDPWSDIERGDTSALAAAELARLGLRPPA